MDDIKQASNAGARSQSRASKKRKTVKAVVAAVVALLLLASVAVYAYSNSVARMIANDKYQAVFLTGGQVYFGKLKKVNSEYYSLKNVFYIQNQNGGDSTEKAAEGSDIQLIKLGSEVHGPDDEMVINKDEVSFFENLKKDSKIAKSIDQYKEDNKD